MQHVQIIWRKYVGNTGLSALIAERRESHIVSPRGPEFYGAKRAGVM
jgi:hypothetical protein